MNRVVVLHDTTSASVVVFGSLDRASAPDVVRRTGLLARRYEEVHIDLGNVGDIDDVGMTLLRSIVDDTERAGARIVIVCESDAFVEPDVA